MILSYYKQNTLIVGVIEFADLSRVFVFICFSYYSSTFKLFFVFFKSI